MARQPDLNKYKQIIYYLKSINLSTKKPYTHREIQKILNTSPNTIQNAIEYYEKNPELDYLDYDDQNDNNNNNNNNNNNKNQVEIAKFSQEFNDNKNKEQKVRDHIENEIFSSDFLNYSKLNLLKFLYSFLLEKSTTGKTKKQMLSELLK